MRGIQFRVAISTLSAVQGYALGESAGSSLVRDSYCVGTLSKSFAHNCSAVLLHLRYPCASAILNFERRVISKSSIAAALYCIKSVV